MEVYAGTPDVLLENLHFFIGVTWFFVLFAVLLALGTSPSKAATRRKRIQFSVVLALFVLGSIAWGTWTAVDATDTVGRLGGLFIAVFGIALAWASLQPREWGAEL